MNRRGVSRHELWERQIHNKNCYGVFPLPFPLQNRVRLCFCTTYQGGQPPYKLEQRLANLILMHASADGVLRMTQQQMASHLGTSREVVARLLHELVAAGHVETGRGSTLIRDVAGLSALISQG